MDVWLQISLARSVAVRRGKGHGWGCRKFPSLLLRLELLCVKGRASTGVGAGDNSGE